ncbi:MAG: GNAT family N-acetyltransferase [Pseudomonadota bacterium]
MTPVTIAPFETAQRGNLVDLAVRAWTGVLDKTAEDVPRFVYDNFYPSGWQARQRADVGALLDTEPQNVWVALSVDEIVGFAGLRCHPEDRMGEIVIVAVDPRYQRRGIARQLMAFAEQRFAEAGLSMVMVETIGDRGHAPARLTYEADGYEPWPVARYFKKL